MRLADRTALDAGVSSVSARVRTAEVESPEMTKVETVAVDIRNNYFVCSHDHSEEAAYDDLAWMTKN